MIVDFHTHIFSPSIGAERDAWLAADPTFRELYASPKALLATGEQLLQSMDRSGIDVSVALGFAWRDLDVCRRHNDYLLEAAASRRGRIVAFCTLPLGCGAEAIAAEAWRCINGGALGFGELRPENVGADLDDREISDALVEAASGLPLLFHVSEPVGHAYAGKRGFAVDAFYRFVLAHPEAKVIGAHWGGGLPFYALMPEVRASLENTRFDTAASSLLYGPEVYARGVDLVGAEKILSGSDFPLLDQARSRRRIEDAGLDAAAVELILGGNAARLLGLE